MVDFGKRLQSKEPGKKVDPISLYETLDRASDKGPLRPAQEAILKEWHGTWRDKRELVVKLHTGQGKTLIGLLMLQSKLNEGKGPALYLCPNHFLVQQTCEQARQFGINTVTAPDDLPTEFFDSKAILVAPVQKLFNGLTKFRLGAKAERVATLLMDDAHACVDSIRAAFTIKVSDEHGLYTKLLSLFEQDLSHQGAGSFMELKNGDGDPILAVPYWAWEDSQHEVLRAINEHRESNEIKFVWPLIKDILKTCQCVVSTGGLEIAPYLPPFEYFGTYTRAAHRIFMSATVTDDSFLVKGLRLPPDAISKPLRYKDEKWSGEKMLLLPSLIGEELQHDEMIKEFATPVRGRAYGLVALAPSFARAKAWQHYDSVVADAKTIDQEIARLRRRDGAAPLVVANRYDGIDLPDDACRILVIDGVPFSENLLDRYEEEHRSGSTLTLMRKARTIEQGLGRAVRGEKDYCVILLVGEDLVRIIRDSRTRNLLSPQTRKQVELGLQIAEMTSEDAETPSLQRLKEVIQQCLARDEQWKEFYVQQMNSIEDDRKDTRALDMLALELDSEQADHDGNSFLAVSLIQKLIDTHVHDNEERGWYLQQMARFEYHRDPAESNRRQLTAHLKNRYLLKPRQGMQVENMDAVSQGRIQRIREWLLARGSNEDILHEIEEIISKLRFATRANDFEDALHRLGTALGFRCQRPDREWGQGPDNLWAVADGEYILFECKSDCNPEKAEIDRKETAQMGNSVEWFRQRYPNAKCFPILVHPSVRFAAGAALPDSVEILRKKGLKDLSKNARMLFQILANKELRDVDDERLQEAVNNCHLAASQLYADYTSKPMR